MSDIKDLSPTIIPKSDQLNSEQLLTGPMTITVTEVSRAQSAEQPIIIHYDNEQGRPYKPCKTMRKVLIAAWGKDGSAWSGRSMTLYNDPEVKWAGEKVGGIRISHLSHMPEGASNIQLSLTVTRGKKSTYTIEKLAAGVDYTADINAAKTMDDLVAAWNKIPKAQQPALASVKDARKAELSKPTNEETV